MSSTLHGRWEMIRAESHGEASPDLLELRVQLELSDGNYIVTFAGQPADRGLFTLEPPATLMLRGTEGTNAGRTIACRYQQVGDRLRVCYGLDGQLPSDFTTAPGQERYLATYRRL